MNFPEYRPRRLRQSDGFRRMIRETRLSVDNLVLPLFVIEGKNIKNEIAAMPGHYQLSIDNLLNTGKEAFELGIPAVILFGIPDKKDSIASNAHIKDGIVQRAVRALKDKIPELVVITDVCLCQYTDHGHCGVIKENIIDNDESLFVIAKTALSHAEAGADMVAPSDMMDGRVGKIREFLDKNSFTNTAIMSYAVKYCSAYYGPFRQAADSSPKFGDRKTYQMDPSNAIEAIREADLDVYEGADIIMVKPALAYLDIIYRVHQEINLPIAAYSVSGEYSMIKAGEKMGWIDGKRIMMETLTAIKRAGANIILTYFAMEAAKVLRDESQ
ncbi:MAG: porphobilinogen synthase [Desulfobacterales bacterium]|nr:porphobilinogen synthase [Desulfobacterales bacterium]MBF0397480.1 porphobilinogen synthase [Desulfobacterales bacterium]